MTKEFIKNKNMKYPDTDMYNYIIAQFATCVEAKVAHARA
jgi:hypothetical protein